MLSHPERSAIVCKTIPRSRRIPATPTTTREADFDLPVAPPKRKKAQPRGRAHIFLKFYLIILLYHKDRYKWDTFPEIFAPSPKPLTTNRVILPLDNFLSTLRNENASRCPIVGFLCTPVMLSEAVRIAARSSLRSRSIPTLPDGIPERSQKRTTPTIKFLLRQYSS